MLAPQHQRSNTPLPSGFLHVRREDTPTTDCWNRLRKQRPTRIDRHSERVFDACQLATGEEVYIPYQLFRQIMFPCVQWDMLSTLAALIQRPIGVLEPELASQIPHA